MWPSTLKASKPKNSSALRAELHGVRRDREVGLDARMRATAVLRMSSAIRRGLGNGSGGGVKRGWKPPTESTKFGVVAERDQHAHLALDRDEEDPRVVQRGEEPDALLVELDRADEVDLQHQDRRVLVGQDDLEHAEDRDVAGDLDDHARARG